MTAPRTVALLMAAGKGLRTGGDTPKQFRAIGGRPMIAWAYDALASHPAVDEVIVLCAEDQRDEAAAALGGKARLVTGGVLRLDSVRNGLEALAGDPPARVLIHDAARPFVPPPVIDRLLAMLDAYEGAIPGLAVADTLVRWDGMIRDSVDRQGVYRIQTPQAFVYEAVLAAHRAWPAGQDSTDDAQMLRATGHEVTIVAGDPALEKVTHAEDFAAAEARLAAAFETRVATGFDVHRLEAGEELWLGGVLIPHDKGLSGHSDADVALHAITDAVLGAIGDGDIGTHFSPSDPQWRGAPSDRFLRHAADLVAAKGGAIGFVDLTLICEAPKIGPYREAMRARIADILRIAPERVSIKATTTERLGFTGRGEGIAAQAVATITLPRR